MECRDVHRLLAQGSSPDGRELQEHVSTCPPCRELSSSEGLTRALFASPHTRSAPDFESVLGGLVERVEREQRPLSWLRSRSTPTRLTVISVALVLLVVGTFLTTPRADLGAYPHLRLIVSLVLMVVGIVAALHLGLSPLHKPRVGRAGHWLAVLTAPLVVTIVAVLPEAHTGHAASQTGAGADFFASALACFIFGMGIGLPALLLLRSSERRSRWTVTGALLTAAVLGAVANLALLVHCPVTNPAHLLLGHALASFTWPLVLGGGVLLAWRSARG